MLDEKYDNISPEELYGTKGDKEGYAELVDNHDASKAPSTASGMMGAVRRLFTKSTKNSVPDEEEKHEEELKARKEAEAIEAEERRYVASPAYIKEKRAEYQELSANMQFKFDYIDFQYPYTDLQRRRRFQEYCFRIPFVNFTGLKQYFESLRLPFQTEGREGMPGGEALARMEHLNEGLDILLNILEPEDDGKTVRGWGMDLKQQRALAEAIERRMREINVYFIHLDSHSLSRLKNVCAGAGYTNYGGLIESFREEKGYARSIAAKTGLNGLRILRPAFQDLIKRLVKLNGCLVEALDSIRPNDFAKFKKCGGSLPCHQFYQARACGKQPYRVNMEWSPELRIKKPEFASLSEAVAHAKYQHAQTFNLDSEAEDKRISSSAKKFPTFSKFISLGDEDRFSSPKTLFARDEESVPSIKTWFDYGEEYYAKHPKERTSLDSEWEFVESLARPNSHNLEGVGSEASISPEDAPETSTVCDETDREEEKDSERERNRFVNRVARAEPATKMKQSYPAFEPISEENEQWAERRREAFGRVVSPSPEVFAPLRIKESSRSGPIPSLYPEGLELCRGNEVSWSFWTQRFREHASRFE